MMLTAEYKCRKAIFSSVSVSALDRPGGLRALAEMLLVPAGGDVWLGAAGARCRLDPRSPACRMNDELALLN